MRKKSARVTHLKDIQEEEHWSTVDRLSKPIYEALQIPSKKSPLRERMKFEAAQIIARYMVENKLSQAELAKNLEINRSLVNKIVHGRLDEFGLDRLTEYVERLYPQATGHFKIAAGQ